MTSFARLLVPAAVLALALGACRSSWRDVKRDPGFRPTASEPVRVAALPFIDQSGGTSPLYYPFIPFIYLASAVTFSIPDAPPDSVKGAETLQSLLLARLGGTPLRVVPPRAILTTLHHKGILEKAHEMDPVELGKILGVDAILYGELLDWAGHYYVAESQTVVEASVKLVSTLDRRVLVSATIGVTDRAGVTGGPTGYVGAAATPVAALGSGPYELLAHAWAEQAAKDLLQSAEAGGETSTSDDPAPFIAAAAVSPPRQGGVYREGELFEVVVLGSSGSQAFFDVGSARTRVPLIETSRSIREGEVREVSAIYRGNFIVSAADRAEGLTVKVTLESRSGRAVAVAEGEPVRIARQ
jgi:hypothetical protein